MLQHVVTSVYDQEITGIRHISIDMADSESFGSDSMCERTITESTGSLIYAVPDSLIQTILQHLSASDLCHVASCCCWLRDATNQDSLWHPLCQSRGWEHYGTTTDLAKIASYGPSEQADGASGAGNDIVTFQKDRIVTDDNTAGLTGTCRWKGVYMRAYHLERNWATNCSHFKEFYLKGNPSWKNFGILIDGDLLAFNTVCDKIQVYDIRKKTLQCVIPSRDISGDWPWSGTNFVFRDGVIVTPYSGTPLYAYNAKTGKLLQKIDGNWGYRAPSLFFDGELIISYVHSCNGENSEMFRDIHVWCVEDGQLQRILRVDPTDGVCICYNVDYRDKMVAAVYDDDYIRVWDARSGRCLHKLKCQGGKSNVKLGDNVIVGFSTTFNKKVCDIIIWSQETEVRQKVIRGVPLHGSEYPNKAEVVTNVIILHDVKKSAPGHLVYTVCAYNLRGELVTEMVNSYEGRRGNGRKRLFWLPNDLVEGSRKTWKGVIFNATSNGFLFDVGRTKFIWIDDIRTIIYNKEEQRLLFNHYW